VQDFGLVIESSKAMCRHVRNCRWCRPVLMPRRRFWNSSAIAPSVTVSTLERDMNVAVSRIQAQII
jgi:hypothetical protein